jgi:hypothetical protein
MLRCDRKNLHLLGRKLHVKGHVLVCLCVSADLCVSVLKTWSNYSRVEFQHRDAEIRRDAEQKPVIRIVLQPAVYEF